MSDEFNAIAQSPLTPSEDAYSITPDDAAQLPKTPKYLYVGTGGNITLRAKDSQSDVTFINVPEGSYLYVRASHVRATGTSAADIVACA